MPRVTGRTVVLPGKYIRGLELRAAAVLWKSLWNCWQQEKFLAAKSCQRIGRVSFPAP
jgi:hypothetical protein